MNKGWKNNPPEKACTGKIKHDSKQEAEQHAETARIKFKKRFDAYWCMHCQYYHIGKKGKGQR